MVGAVVVRRGRVVAEGYHRRAGGAHAEVTALAAAAGKARGADLYLTLEPCVHAGRTPACVPAVLAAGVARVIVASRDPNPRVRGRGLAALRRAGISVVEAPRAFRAREHALNERFRTWMMEGRPFVLAKWAASLDGRTAAASGQSQWITGPAARRRSLALRQEYDAILVGAGTVLADDPRLTRRPARPRATPHWRIVLDGRLRVPTDARVFRGRGERLVVTARPLSHPKAVRLLARGVRVWSLPRGRGRVDLARLLAELARHEVSGLIVEGGAETLWSFFDARLVDRVAVFLAPRILGGARAPAGVAGKGFALAATPELTGIRVETVGGDVLVTGRVAPD